MFDPPLRHTLREIREHGVHPVAGWSVKLYAIAGKPPHVAPELLEIAKSVAAAALPNPARNAFRYGVAFAVIHEAAAFNTILVDWWEQVNELRHRVFRALPGAPLSFQEITATGESVCVWELRVQAFERQAWLDHVLQRSGGPDFAGYLASRIHEMA